MRICLLILLWVVPSDQNVKLIGLFPQCDNESLYQDPFIISQLNATDAWCRHSWFMFFTAISLANQYNIKLNNQNISGDIIQTTKAEDGHDALNRVCRYISTQGSNVVGIVGPDTSNNARFIVPFAAHIHLPVVSYAATNAELSDIHRYPTFYRVVPSDFLLARAIVDLFKKFKWTTCTIIVQKDEYGYGGLNILSEYYQQHIAIKKRLTFDGIDFNANLTKTLSESRSRIVLVWADRRIATSIVNRALDEGVIGAPYVWITTDEVILNASSSNTSQSNQTFNKLEGLLTVMPLEFVRDNDDIEQWHINRTLYNDALNVWHNLLRTTDHEENGYFHNISSFSLFAFDATWTLIKALNSTSFDEQSSIPWFKSSSYCFDSSLENAVQYHKHIDETNFLGISGPVSFAKNISNDRVAGAYYVLKNLQLQFNNNKHQLIYKNILKWSNESFNENETWRSFTKEHIVWPNRSKTTPTDYPKVRGEHLVIRVIDAPPFVMLWNKSSTSQTKPSKTQNFLQTEDKNIEIYGYVADLIVELQAKMEFTSTISAWSSNMSYNSLVKSIYDNGTGDIIISDVTITSSRLLTVDFSLPFYENSVRIVIRDTSSFSAGFFGYLRPFSLGVWLSMFGIIIYSGLLIYLFERDPTKKEVGFRRLRAIILGVYEALGCFVGFTNDFKLQTRASRILIIALFIMSIILVATYTANLSSFLTTQRSQPYISGIDDIKNGRLPFERIGILNGSAHVDSYKQNVSPIYYPVNTKRERLTLLLENRIDASIGDALALEYTVDREYCGRLLVVGVGFAKSSFGIVMAKNWPYKADFDVNILSLREEGKLDSLERKWLLERLCSSKPNEKTWEQDGVPMDVMTGLFASFLVVTGITLIIHFYRHPMAIKEYCKAKPAPDVPKVETSTSSHDEANGQIRTPNAFDERGRNE